jgi:hypothetical protein
MAAPISGLTVTRFACVAHVLLELFEGGVFVQPQQFVTILPPTLRLVCSFGAIDRQLIEGCGI